MHEINLLPPSRRKTLKKQWLRHASLQFLNHIIVALGVVTVLGIATGGVLQVLVLVTPTSAESVLSSLVGQYQTARQEILQKNLVLREISATTTSRVVWSDTLSELLSAIPPGTNVRSIQSIGNPPKLTFAGTSVNRNSLIILQTRLQQFSWAKEVTSPLQNLLDKENPEYSFAIIIDNPGEQNTQ